MLKASRDLVWLPVKFLVLVTLLCVCHRVRSGRVELSCCVGGMCVDVVARVSGAAGAGVRRCAEASQPSKIV